METQNHKQVIFLYMSLISSAPVAEGLL